MTVTSVDQSEPSTQKTRWYALYLSLAAIAFGLTLFNSPGSYIADFRYEVAWAPDKTLTRIPSLWQTAGGLGGIAGTDRSLLPTLFFGTVRALGAPAWVAQRLWHGGLMFLGAGGVVQLVRFYYPRPSLRHWFAGLAFMLSPVGLGLLLPSPIYAVYAVVPWILASFMFGSSGQQPWRWSAAFALCLMLAAPIEMPATLFGLAFLVPVGVVMVHLERSTSWRSVWQWTWRAAALATLSLSFVVARTFASRGSLERRLFVSESPETVSTTTSWSEVFRGLGHWQTYFLGNAGGPRPHFAVWLESPVVVVATFLVPLVALTAALSRDWLAARYWAAIGFLSLVLAVGLHPVDEPSPWGRFLEFVYESWPSTTLFRSTMKAAAPWALVVALLFGAAVVAASAALPRLGRAAVSACALCLLIVASWPAWSGNLYPPSSVEEVPDYWSEAMGWLNDAARDGNVLVLPGASSANYRWGQPGDDLFQAGLDRRYVAPMVFALSEASAHDALFELERSLAAEVPPESLVASLNRLGVSFVVVRNDLAWESMGIRRPTAFESLRTDDGLELVATFGEPGQNTTAGVLAPSPLEAPLLSTERRLAPVEIFAVPSTVNMRVVSPHDEVVFSGDGEGWQRLEALGLDNGDLGLRYVDSATDEQLSTALDGGGVAVVTDTNARRRILARGSTAFLTAPIFAAEDADVTDALPTPLTSQTVAWSPDAVSITSSVPETAAQWIGARSAFDGDPQTAWRVPRLVTDPDPTITITLRSRRPIGSVVITPAAGPVQVAAGWIQLDDGLRRPFRMSEEVAKFDLNGTPATVVRIGIRSTSGLGQSGPGFAEIEIEGLDLRIGMQTPTSLVQRARANETLRTALGRAPMSFSFQADNRAARPVAEVSMLRRFETDGLRRFFASGRLAIAEGSLTMGCQPVVTIDDQQVRARLTPLGDGTADWEACDPVVLRGGTHVLSRTGAHRLISAALVDNKRTQEEVANRATTELLSVANDELLVKVRSAEAGMALVTGISYHSGWKAQRDGQVVEGFEMDGQLAFRLPSGDSTLLIEFAPQRLFGVSIALAFLGLAVNLALLSTPTVAGSATSLETKARSWPRLSQALSVVAIPATVLVVSYLAAGWLGLLASLSAWGVGYGFGWRFPAGVGLSMIAAGAVWSLVEGSRDATFSYALDRPVAAGLVQFGAVTFTTVVALQLRAPAMGKPQVGSPVSPAARPQGRIFENAALAATCLALGSCTWVLVGEPAGDLAQAIARARSGVPYSDAVNQLSSRVQGSPLAVHLGAHAPGNLSVWAGIILGASTTWFLRTCIAARSLAKSRAFVAALGIVAIASFGESGHVFAIAFGLALAGTLWHRSGTAVGVIVAGGLAGLAVIAAPEALLVVVAFIVCGRRPGSLLGDGLYVLVVGTAALTWWAWAWSNIDGTVITDAIDAGGIARAAVLSIWTLYWWGAGTRRRTAG